MHANYDALRLAFGAVRRFHERRSARPWSSVLPTGTSPPSRSRRYFPSSIGYAGCYAQDLLEKVRALPDDGIAEVADFVEFLRQRSASARNDGQGRSDARLSPDRSAEGRSDAQLELETTSRPRSAARLSADRCVHAAAEKADGRPHEAKSISMHVGEARETCRQLRWIDRLRDKKRSRSGTRSQPARAIASGPAARPQRRR
jgi:hypothetical protein